MLSKVAFEQIKDNYYYGAYGEFRVIIDKSNGYISATKMCSSAGKKFKDWKRNVSSQELIRACESQMKKDMVLENMHPNNENLTSTLGDLLERICTDRFFACKKVAPSNFMEVDRLISGTYCHPELIPHIACWLSPSFALKVSKVINSYIMEEYRVKLETSEEEAVELRSILQHSHQSLQAREQQTQYLESTSQNKDRRHEVWSSTHSFSMLRTNNPQSKLPYYAIRCKRIDMSGAIRKLRAKHPHSIMVYQSSHVPNPVNLYNRLKSSGVLQFKGNYCSSLVHEADLITKLGELYTVIE
jgi:KilA-N domain/Protein of unknown function (DUF3627)